MSGDFQIGEWCVQPAVNRLNRGDHVIRLEPKVMLVLVCLAEHAGEVVTREQLIASAWPDVFVTDDVLHRAIRELRRVFGDSTSSPRYIETIRKRGYRLIPPASSASKGVPDNGDSPPFMGTVPVPGDRPRARWPFSALAAGVALAVLGAVGILLMRDADLTPDAHARFVPVVSGPLNETDPALSPDGRRIAFVQREPGDSTSADIYIRDLDAGRVTRVTHHPASDRMPAWSPDGLRLAYVRETATSCEIVIHGLATDRETVLAPCANAEDPKLTWTADGRGLLTSHAPAPRAASGWRIARIDLATGALATLTNPAPGLVGDHSPAVSPDGRRMAFIRRSSGSMSDIHVASITGGDLRRVTFDAADLTGLDWTGDGHALVYSSDRAGGYSVWRVPATGGPPSLLAGGAARMKHPVTDRTSRRVIYENWNYEINLWQTGTGEAPITRTSELWNLYPQVSPDGTRVAYVSTQSGSHQLWLAARDGGNAHQLTRVDGGAVSSPRWSPDGRRIVYLARGRIGVDVHFVDVATGAVTEVTSNAAIEVAPAWSHDGRRILFGAPDDRGGWSVWSVDASMPSDARLEIADAVAAQPSPDGTAWYFTRPTRAGLWRARRGDDTADCILTDIEIGNVFGWHVARDAIYFVDERDDRVLLRRSTLDGETSMDVATLTQITWPGFSVAPDGAVLYARWDRRDSNLMSIEY
jgi:Tol biopolymer transport system component/DNA-binding winged helix-turn-helix (wHTH) protein